MKPIINSSTQLFLLIIVLILVSCAEKILPTAPNVGEIEIEQPEESTVILPLSANISDITSTINQKVPRGLVHHQHGISGFHAGDIRIYRNADIYFSANSNRLRFKIPIHVDVYVAARKTIKAWPLPDIHVTKTGRGLVDFNLYLDAGVNIDSLYNFHVDTKLTYDLNKADICISLLGDIGEWIGDPKVCISVRGLVRPKLNDAVKDFIPELNKLLEDELNGLNMRDQIVRYWEELGKPQKLAPSVWLESDPTKVYFNNLKADNNIIKFQAGLGTKLKMVLADSAKAHANPVPNLEVNQDIEGSFNIHLPIGLSFKQIEKMLNDSIAGKQFIDDKNKYKVKIRHVNLFGARNEQSNMLVSGIDFSGKVIGVLKRVKGTMWFYITPAYDVDNQVVYLEDFRLTPETNSLLLNKGFPWLIDKFYMEKLKVTARYDLSKDLSKYKDLINSKISSIDLGGLTAKGQLEELSFDGFKITPNELKVLIKAFGSLDSQPVILDRIAQENNGEKTTVIPNN